MTAAALEALPPLVAIRHHDGALTAVAVTVYGTPAPQGSKRAFVNRHTGRVQMKESSEKVRPWREAVALAITSETGGTLLFGDGPVLVTADFFLARPKSHYGTGKNAGVLKPAAREAWPAAKPDADKLARSTLDGLGSAGAYADDSQVVDVRARKLYVDGLGRLAIPGARILVARIGGLR